MGRNRYYIQIFYDSQAGEYGADIHQATGPVKSKFVAQVLGELNATAAAIQAAAEIERLEWHKVKAVTVES